MSRWPGDLLPRWLSYLRCGAATTVDVVAYAASGGHYLFLEGRRQGKSFHNWALRFRQTPRQIAQPTTEAQIIALVRDATCVRVVGSGHSFNEGIVTDEVLVNLDNYAGLTAIDDARKQLTFRAGTRVREVVKIMRSHGLAFTALPSHDAQSIAGILSTDVHGTGRGWGFVSESVLALKLIDGTGNVHQCTREDQLFWAAIGGVGAVGIIVEVTVSGIDAFTIDQQTEIRELSEVRAQLDELIATHDHLSLYLFPYAPTCQVNIWDRSSDPATAGGGVKEFINISVDALLAAWIGGLLAYTRLLPLAQRWSRVAYLVRRGTRVVLDSAAGYNRTIYHLHQELEFTVPYEQTFEVCDALLELYQQRYESQVQPYFLLEVRFTPEGHTHALVGPGAGRRSTYIDLIVNDSAGCEELYAAATELIKKVGGQPHLGKYAAGFDRDYLAEIYGERFDQFRALMAEHDPDGKFSNSFTRRMFGSPPAP